VGTGPFYLLGLATRSHSAVSWNSLTSGFNLSLDFSDIDRRVKSQNEKLARLRTEFPEIDRLITKLESNQALSDEENEKLANEVQESITETGAD